MPCAALVTLLSLVLIAPATGVTAKGTGAPEGASAVPAVPLFVEDSGVGVDHVYDGSWQFFTGGGVAVLDCDDDGLLDLYFAGGEAPAGLYRNESTLGGPLAFSQLPSEVTDLAEVTGAYAIDIDSDGTTDLAVLRRGENVLLRGLGGCAFERANEAWGFDGDDDWTAAFSAKWEAGDAFPTLAVGDYLTIVEQGELPVCDESAVYRPGADGYGEPEVLAPGYCALSMLFSDWDRSGRRDLHVTNDRQYYRPEEGEDQLWKVRPDEPLTAYTREDGWEKLSVFGMGIASEDVTGDGYPEYFITTMAGNRLRTLADGPEQPTFTDSAYARGVDVAQPFTGGDTLPSTAWHAEFDDVNNDGRSDLYVSKGNVELMPDHAAKDPSNLLIGQPDGTWAEGAEEAGIVHFGRTRGAALVDLNLDGLLDLVEVVRREPARVWRNAGAGTPEKPAAMGSWLAVELAQAGRNRDAIGAWIEVRADGIEALREVTIGGGHASGALGPVHVGLGKAKQARVRVTWPDGEVGEWLRVGADQRIRIQREANEPLALTSATRLTGAPGADQAPVTPDGRPLAPVDPASCVRSVDDGKSVARLWNEALLDAIRRDFPAPTVHARNLFHLSAAMWDAWAAYDRTADGVFVNEKHELARPASARKKAISYAAYRVLSHRYRNAVGGSDSLRQFDELMADLCYATDRTYRKGDSPAALGNRIAASIIRRTLDDGSRESEGYVSSDYQSVNEPMVVELPGTHMADPNRWQPLALEVSYTQNGQLLPIGPQEFVGPHWGEVTAFALPEPVAPGLPVDPGTPPLLHDPRSDAQFKQSAVEVLRYSSQLDPRDGVVVDISPASLGGSTLGTNDGSGHEVNPITGLPYAPNEVLRADFARVLAEYWADGPESETPPGHWNAIANSVSDMPGFERRIGGVGTSLDPLEWDVKLYLALNGAVHDAAIAAWGAKGHYDYVRPISMIRWMGGLGQSSDPDLPAYHPDGLPLIPGEVELITKSSTAAGQRHSHLAEHIGEIAVLAWSGNPDDSKAELGGVDWIRAVEWVPYQLETFVTPAFAAYVSGHSAFSRAGAEVLAAMTGSEYFPAGLSSWKFAKDSLDFEQGPSQDIELQWATYYDAADQAGISRLYGGIHVAADDLQGRVMGAQCGRDALALAQRYWDGSARDRGGERLSR
jgi:hypothetical protein